MVYQLTDNVNGGAGEGIIMDKILSFGGGLQTTALAIMLAERKYQVDAVVFSDTGAE